MFNPGTAATGVFHPPGQVLVAFGTISDPIKLRPPFPGVAVHAAISSVRDPQSGWLHALLSERADGQVHADLPGG